MKVNLYGCNANMAYLIAKFLRRKGIEADVFVDRPPLFNCNLPSWEEGENRVLPPWVKFVDVDLKRIIHGAKERKFLKNLADCDMIHTIGEAGIWPSFTKRPYLYWSYGFDLDILPFKSSGAKERLLSFLQRRALKKAVLILYPMPHQTGMLEKLKLRNGRFFLPMVPIDTQKYSRNNSSRSVADRSSYACKWLFLHPSRQEWTRDIPDNKGNDRLYRAFADFLKEERSAKMIIFNKGRDVEASRKLIKNLRLENNIIWEEQQNKDSLLKLYNISDLVFDQFNIGSPGLISWEALSMGLPTFVYMVNRWRSYCKDLPPVINVRSAGEILKGMNRLCNDQRKIVEIGIKSRAWIIKYFHWEKVIDQYIGYYNQILNGQDKAKEGSN